MTEKEPMTLEALKTSTRATLTRNEVAELFGVNPRSVTRAIEHGEIPAVRFGTRIIIPREAILKLLLATADQSQADQ